MPRKNHEIFKDASLTFGASIQRRVTPIVDYDTIEIAYDAPTEADIAKAQKSKKSALVSVLHIDTTKSKNQSNNQPVVMEEDEDGNLVEFRCGPPTYMNMRYIVTPWLASSLDNQVLTGAFVQAFRSFPEAHEDDIQGDSMKLDDAPAYELDQSLGYRETADVMKAYNLPYRPSLLYIVQVKVDSALRVPIQRVREKVNLYRHLQG